MHASLHCPYCVKADGFRELIKKAGGEYVCSACGHSANPDDTEWRCCCARCQGMNLYIENAGYSPSESHKRPDRVTPPRESGSHKP